MIITDVKTDLQTLFFNFGHIILISGPSFLTILIIIQRILTIVVIYAK